MTGTEQLWRSFRGPLAGFVRDRVAHAADAEDILGDVFLKLQQRLPELDTIDDPRAWLYQVTRNAVIDHYRRVRPDRQVSELYDLPVEPEPDETEKLAGCVKSVLETLPDNDRRALLTLASGQNQQQLADHENLSPTGARSRVQRARKRLREAFDACCNLELDGRGRPIDCHTRRDDCD